MSHRSRFTRVTPLRVLILPLVAFVAAACERNPATATDEPVVVDALFDRGSNVGGPLSFISREDRRAFARGREVFSRVFTPEDGLGPLFNSRGCAVCHSTPVVGGVGTQIETHATAFVADDCEEFDELNGGSVVQDSSTPALLAHGIDGEPMFPGTTGAGRRSTRSLFGFGLMEAVDGDEIQRRADPDDRNHDGISGRATLVQEEDGDEILVGRFGKKGQVPDLRDFIIDALIYEQGVTSADEEEQLVAGEALPEGVDPAADPELGDDDLADLIKFVQLLAPSPSLRLNRTGEAGRELFREIGCSSCHTPAMRTAGHEIRSLNGRIAVLYSDLLIHDLGQPNADICNGNAQPAEFRTEPLMGLRFGTTFMHDGSASTISQAILAHGGEGARARAKFERLSSRQREALLTFLRSL